MSWIHPDAAYREDKPQEDGLGDVKLALLCFHKQMILQQAMKHDMDMYLMFLRRAGKDENVIKVNKDILIQHLQQHIIDECLAYRR